MGRRDARVGADDAIMGRQSLDPWCVMLFGANFVADATRSSSPNVAAAACACASTGSGGAIGTAKVGIVEALIKSRVNCGTIHSFFSVWSSLASIAVFVGMFVGW